VVGRQSNCITREPAQRVANPLGAQAAGLCSTADFLNLARHVEAALAEHVVRMCDAIEQERFLAHFRGLVGLWVSDTTTAH